MPNTATVEIFKFLHGPGQELGIYMVFCCVEPISVTLGGWLKGSA